MSTAGKKLVATREHQLDGLVGPTHNYAGLSYGNVASQNHEGQVSRPRDALKEGLAKMASVTELGVPQLVMPPLERPRLDVLRGLGFEGDDARVVARAHGEAPQLLASVYSASAMWAANAATVCPSADASDGRVHFTVANLSSTFHRSLEPVGTDRALRRLFAGERFVHHGPLPATPFFGDEGAANHTRLHADHLGTAGLQIFVYQRSARGGRVPLRFPARQTREACEAIARRHRLGSERVLFLQQNPDVVDRGVFHNDVIAVGHERTLLWHEHAFLEPEAVDAIRRRFEAVGGDLLSWKVEASELSVDEAVQCYLFNSQLLAGRDGMVLFAPREVEESAAGKAVVDRLLSEGLRAVRYLDVRQSMSNGGGPACLRLRVTLTDDEAADVLPGVRFDATLRAKLETWADTRYREELRPSDLADPKLAVEAHEALDELTQILGLGGDFYAFQQA
ncbi:MAG: N-succinylarginine dihydrolase [Sandaracinus sp.]|nr:N-succinylarginine dihydrolase [Sandaracinus sp.]